MEQQIGFPINIKDGEFFQTRYVEGRGIQLLEKKNFDGLNTYHDYGYWVSSPINLLDKFKNFSNFVFEKTDEKEGEIFVYTATSDDGINFNEFQSVVNGVIASEIKKYIKIKIEIYSFLKEIERNVFFDMSYSNNFISIREGQIKQNTSFLYDGIERIDLDGMTLNSYTINADFYKRIDKIN